jgi:hypothetical protein
LTEFSCPDSWFSLSRPWRIEYEGALYHLLSCGNAGNAIFVDDKDRGRFLDAAGEMSQRFDIDIFAYVLMDNITTWIKLFGVSHAVKSAKLKLTNSRQLQIKFNQLYSPFKL